MQPSQPPMRGERGDSYTPLQCATFALYGIGAVLFAIVVPLWVYSKPDPDASVPPRIILAFALALPHVLACLPSAIRSARSREASPKEERRSIIGWVMGFAPTPSVQRSHPWTRWAFGFGVASVAIAALIGFAFLLAPGLLNPY